MKFALNEDLTYLNNPRYPIFENLTISGNIIEKNEPKNFNSLDFCCLFFHNKPEASKLDWVSTVGPELRKMGLLYPSMQRIVDLYNFKSLSMPAMKRAFDIEDERNTRYMPTTREMSKLTHRNIRRWLYDPLYNSTLVPVPKCRENRIQKLK